MKKLTFILAFLLAKNSFATQPKMMDKILVVASAPIAGDNFTQPTQIDSLQGDEKRIREQAGLGQSLDHIAGIGVISTGGQVGKPVIRGLSGERIRVVSNGVGVDHQQFDSRHGPNIDPFLSEKIEVIQGPASILYGSGALGGAVDVTSLPLEFSASEKFEIDGELMSGFATNNDQFDRGAKVKIANKNWAVSGAGILRNGENITTPNAQVFYPNDPPNAGYNTAPAFAGELPFTDFDQENRQFGIGYKSGENEYKLRYTKYDTKQRFLLSPEAHGHEEEAEGEHEEEHSAGEGSWQNLKNDELQLASKIKISDDFTFKPTLSWQRNLRQETHSNEVIDVEFDLYTGSFITEHKKLGIFDGGKIGFEISHKDQNSTGSEQLSPGGIENNYAIFALEEKQIEKLKLQFGLRHDWREVEAQESKTTNPENFSGNVKKEFSAFSGSIGGAYELSKNLVAASTLGRGFRAPTLFELFSGGTHTGISAIQQGNQNLKEETSLNADFSLRYRSKNSKASATIYRNKINNYIYLNNTGLHENGVPIFDLRQDDALIRGFNLDASTFLTDWLEIRGVFEFIDGENLRTNQDLPQIPANEVRFEATFYPPSASVIENPYLRTGMTYASTKRAAEGEPFAQFDSENYGTGSVGDYALLDLAAGFELDLRKYRFPRAFVDMELKNATNETYRNFLDTYKGYGLSPGRNFRVNVRIPF